MPKYILLIFAQIICLQLTAQKKGAVLHSSSYKHYIDSFNTHDDELYSQHIPNADSWQSLEQNIPLLDCPDKSIEQTWYFRWWTYRKHIQSTTEGFVITEFLPKVPWSGTYNTINCPAAHHIYEGRWLHNAAFVKDYLKFWLTEKAAPRQYSFWLADALWQYYLISGDSNTVRQMLPGAIRNYEGWEKTHLAPNGLFWQIDGYDGMEVSICGKLSEKNIGYRATINSYMYGDALAIYQLSSLLKDTQTAAHFQQKAISIKEKVQTTLWDDNAAFYKVLPKGSNNLCNARELHGYTPCKTGLDVNNPTADAKSYGKLLLYQRKLAASTYCAVL